MFALAYVNQKKLDKAPSERKFKRAEKFIQEFRLQDNGKKTAKKMSTVKKLGSKPDKNVKLVFAYRTTRCVLVLCFYLLICI